MDKAASAPEVGGNHGTMIDQPVEWQGELPDATLVAHAQVVPHQAFGKTAALAGALTPAPSPATPRPTSPLDYLIDVWQRNILFLDVLRERANNIIEHERAGLPPPLKFDYETILDARRLERPSNYALLHITVVGEDCLEDCVDPAKPPVIVIDPRAGHGPGIGGFKRDSEIGIAFHEGYPVYFVTFYPEPCPEQTLSDVLHALRRFVEDVSKRHDGRAPVLYGNCQAGWAAVLVSADCEGLSGPVVLNGSPLSYWAGEAGVNPMRVLGGLVGGVWLTHFLADLGDGRLDGAWLVENFENLKPENAIWEKYVSLFNDPDGERERFLEFERWWNGFHSLGREEILAIVENLFIGNLLEEGKLKICDDHFVDLKRIRNPLVIFASYGDNITPPHQALAWIPAVYKDTVALKESGQRIVYLTNPHVGHLGIFVSASVARFEHRAILENLPEIEALAPGLYEMKIANPTGNPDCRKPQYHVRFEERQVSDIRFEYPHHTFERVRSMSEANEALYRTFVSPWVRALSSPWAAAMLKWLHPMRTSHLMFSEKINPWMIPFAGLAVAVRAQRRPLDAKDPAIQRERELVGETTKSLTSARKQRDQLYESLFSRLYGR